MARGNRRGGRTVAALLGLCALAGVAFLIGALAGLVWKEPSLLLAYLSGETTEVAWETAATDVTPAIAEAPDADAIAADPVPEPLAKAAPAAPPVRPPPATQVAAVEKPAAPAVPAPKPKPPAPVTVPPTKPTRKAPAVAAAPPVSRVAIQVGAFADRTAADRLRASLESDGYPAYVVAGVGSDSPHWRVRVGPYPTRDEAGEIAQLLKRTHELPTWVLDEHAE